MQRTAAQRSLHSEHGRGYIAFFCYRILCSHRQLLYVLCLPPTCECVLFAYLIFAFVETLLCTIDQKGKVGPGRLLLLTAPILTEMHSLVPPLDKSK